MPKTERVCKICGYSFLADNREIRRGNAKFCSRSCAAIYGNSLRRRSAEPNHVCLYCGKAFFSKVKKKRRKYCSAKCFYLATNRLLTREQLILTIKQFYKKNGRIPFYTEFRAKVGYPNPDTYKAVFGSWNKAIKAAGFEPNQASLGFVVVAKDGHICRSVTEKIIDDWLFDNGIIHEKEVLYPSGTRRADWKVGDVYIEFLGLDLDSNYLLNIEYRRSLIEKRRICQEEGIKLVEIFPQDLECLEEKIGMLKN